MAREETVTDTSQQLVALAAATKVCPDCIGKGRQPVLGGRVNETMACLCCYGSGTVPLVAGLRQKCQWAASIEDYKVGAGLTMKGLQQRIEYHESTWENCCHGLGWLPVSEQEAGWAILQWIPKAGTHAGLFEDIVVAMRFGQRTPETVINATYAYFKAKALIEHV